MISKIFTSVDSQPCIVQNALIFQLYKWDLFCLMSSARLGIEALYIKRNVYTSMNCDTSPTSVTLANGLSVRDHDGGMASEDSSIGNPKAFFLPWEYSPNTGPLPFIQESVKGSCPPDKPESSHIKVCRKIMVSFLSSTLAQGHTIGQTNQTKNGVIVLHCTQKSNKMD